MSDKHSVDATPRKSTRVGYSLCGDCPPVDFPPDYTRCVWCPHRLAESYHAYFNSPDGREER